MEPYLLPQVSLSGLSTFQGKRQERSNAQKEWQAMPKFNQTIKVNSPPEKAWAVVGDLAGVNRWIPGITGVKVEGNKKRICTFADGHIQHEEIIGYSNEKRSYSYTIEGLQGMRNNRGTFAVKQDGEGSVIVWESEFDVLDPALEAEMTQMWKGATVQIAESLRKLIEEE